jgi:hypothetical protein
MTSSRRVSRSFGIERATHVIPPALLILLLATAFAKVMYLGGLLDIAVHPEQRAAGTATLALLLALGVPVVSMPRPYDFAAAVC